jgi:hypothetical protein
MANQPKKDTKDQVYDLGIDGVSFRVDISDEYTGRAGLCVRVRGWTDYRDGRVGPTKNGMYVPVEFAPMWAQAILDAYNRSTDSNLQIADFPVMGE